MTPLMCYKWSFLPLNACSYMVTASAILAGGILLNLLAIALDRFNLPAAHSLRPGSLRLFFYLTCAVHIVLVVLPFAYVVKHFESLLVTGSTFCICIHSAFWLICLIRLVNNRHFHELPISLVSSYAIASILAALPLFFWSSAFPNGFTESYFLFYIIEAVLIYTVLLAAVSKSTLRQEYYSPWENFAQKTVRIMPYVWPRKSFILQFYVFVCLLLLAVGRVINVMIPMYSKWIVDALTGPNPFCYKLILIATGMKYLQGSATGGFLKALSGFLWIRVQQYTTIEIEVDMFKHLHQLSLRWHLSRKTGEVMRIMDRGTSSINTLLSYVLFNVLPTIIDILFASIFFFVNFNVYFGLLVILTMTVYLVVTIFITEWRSKYRKEMNECENRASTIGVDSLLNYETIKYYNAEMLEVQRYRTAYEIYQAAEYRANASLAFLNITQNTIIGIGLMTGSLLVAYLISMKNSGLTAGDYVLFTTYILQLYGPLNFFGSIYRTIQRAFIDMENMLELFEQEVEIQDIPGAVELEKCPGSIEFQNVYFAYKPEKVILSDVSFTVAPGETIALVGPSGSGKSTIVRLLFRLYDVTSGEIRFNGKDVRHLKLQSFRQGIGIVPQDTVLFNDTIHYNIRYGRPEATDVEIEEAAKAAAIHEFIVSHPDGYNCLVGERGLKLSGGEKQRVAIARTILKQPEYILLDEATSALDSRTERSIQNYLFELCHRRTCVIVAHRLSTIVHADKILVLSDGRIVESGSHSELLSKDGVYAEMWNLQQNGGGQDGDETATVVN